MGDDSGGDDEGGYFRPMTGGSRTARKKGLLTSIIGSRQSTSFEVSESSKDKRRVIGDQRKGLDLDLWGESHKDSRTPVRVKGH